MQGVSELRQLIRGVVAAEADPSRFVVDLSIARGLDYYTGMIYETILDELPNIGSVCSGGRYDNLAELFTRQQLPGIGASLGLDRLLAAMEQLGRLPAIHTPAQVLIVQFDTSRLGDYLRIAARLRAAGIGTEIYPDAKKVAQQFKYADRKGFAAAVVAGANEFDKNIVQVKWLADGNQVEVSLNHDLNELILHLRDRLEPASVA